MQRICIALALTALLSSTAQAQGNRGPYDSAVRCFVTAGYVRNLQKDAGRAEAAAATEQKVKENWGVAFILGKAVGFNESRVKRDLDAASSAELPKLVSDTGYLRSSVQACKAAGFM